MLDGGFRKGGQGVGLEIEWKDPAQSFDRSAEARLLVKGSSSELNSSRL